MMYLGSPICFMAMQKWPFWRTWSIRIGFIIIIAALVTSSFATDVWHLVFTQGALYAVGGTLAYGPAIVFLMNGLSAGKGCLWGNVGCDRICRCNSSFPHVLDARALSLKNNLSSVGSNSCNPRNSVAFCCEAANPE
ncbi:hypothetical protein CPC735_017090 [Coccidioides posadasii C735 delta SOWgp]|uniref:Uncharacterized protein n=1 Tax=Coccidioides posadasii (strain C735) TaxID=222929 RepID=C5PDE6_COCP7|nr:hypothetical protein CPC735_017090 [Coccidioides posadasii C735 delta SOWgp]EER25107.1 hypothetical protein CPC735_017090 [Coccidioides posadasii C735 delta SOWgp]|eukprot:XP_003067252.1 hypothetical protein CPC735_017090 [Coccidioides posadasii C735 delta SOWgp]